MIERRDAKRQRRRRVVAFLPLRVSASLRATLFSALLVVVSAVGCSKRDDDAITLQLNWKPEPEFGGFYAADFAKHGLNVTIAQGGAGAPTVELLGAGRVPFAIVSADEIPKAREVGAHVVALFAVYQTFPQGILTRTDRGLKSMADVFDTPGTLAIEQGLPYGAFLKNKYGFDKQKLAPSPFGDLALLRTDKSYAMQCYVTAEPLAAKKDGLDVTTFMIADAGYDPYGTVLATTDEYLADHPDRVKRVVAAVAEGWRKYLDDPAATNEAMHELNPTMDADTFAAAAAAQKPLIETADTRAHGLGVMTEGRWQTLLDTLRRLKVFTADVKPSDCYKSVTP